MKNRRLYGRLFFFMPSIGIKSSLQTRLIIHIVLLLSLVMIITTYVGIKRESQGILQQMQKDGIALAKSYGISVENALLLGGTGLSRVTGVAGRTRGINFLMVIDTTNAVIGHTDSRMIGSFVKDDDLLNNALHAPITALEKGRTPITEIGRHNSRENTFRVVIPLVTLSTIKGALELELDMTGISEAINRTNQQSLLIAFAAFLCSGVYVWFFSQTLTRPIKNLVRAARSVAAGDLNQELPVPGRDEISLLSDSFNYMTEKLREVRDLQHRIHQSEKLALLGELAMGVAHEVRNPLGAIKTCGQFLEEKLGHEDKRAKFTQLIIREADRLDQLVSRLLNFARPAERQLQYEDINELLDNAITLAVLKINGPRIAVKKNFCDGLPQLFIDAKRLSQAFLNILLNAIDAMPGSGILTLSTAVEEEPRKVVITITDTGEGIPQESLDKIFYPYFTTRPRGTGLGLAIVQQIIAEHNGSIDVKSMVGEGTIITIALPIA
jgi:signal transduction histidine kinase